MKKPIDLSSTTTKSFFIIFYEVFTAQFILFYKRIIRIVLHYLTGKSELERICLNEKIESVRIRKIGNFINFYYLIKSRILIKSYK